MGKNVPLSLRKRYALAFDGFEEAQRRLTSERIRHLNDTDELRREVETLRMYREDTEEALRKLRGRLSKKHHQILKDLHLYRLEEL